MRISPGIAALIVLAIGFGGGRALSQEPGEDGGEAVEERGAPRELQIGDFVYRLGSGLPAGPFRLHPYGAQYVVYDDNVFLSDPDELNREETEEIALETILGLRTDLPLQDHHVTAEYQAQFVQYLEDTPDIVRQMARGELSLRFTRSYAMVTDTYRNTDDPVGLPDLGRFRRATNFIDAVGGVRFEKLGLEVGVHHKYYDFFNSETNYLDHNEASIHGKLFYEFTPKFTAYAQLDYGTVAFGDDESRSSSPAGSGVTLNDYDYTRFWGGAKYRASQKLSFDGRVGVMAQSVDKGSGTIGDDDDYQGPVAGLAVAYSPGEKVKVTAEYLRDLQFSGTGNFQVVDRVNGRLDYQLTEKFRTSGLVFLENSAPSRTDPFQRAGVGAILDWRVENWVHLGAGYQYRQRVASDIGDYTNNRILGNVSIYF